MDGMIFYWLSWLFWVLSTFFMKKQRARLLISFWILLVIILSIHSIKIASFEISMPSLFILLSTYVVIGRQKRRTGVYVFLTSFLVMLAYSVFHLFELFDPVWLIFDRNWMLAFVLTYLSVIIQNDFKMRLITLLGGAIHGDILYSLLLKKYSFEYEVGSLLFLDCMAISAASVLMIHGFRRGAQYFENHFHPQEREKQKLS